MPCVVSMLKLDLDSTSYASEARQETFTHLITFLSRLSFLTTEGDGVQ